MSEMTVAWFITSLVQCVLVFVIFCAVCLNARKVYGAPTGIGDTMFICPLFMLGLLGVNYVATAYDHTGFGASYAQTVTPLISIGFFMVWKNQGLDKLNEIA